jgi:quercetin dioxygenase-like cupin family protein
MKQKLTLPLLLIIQFLFACSSSDKKQHQLNIDPVKISPGLFKVLSENDHVRVVKYSLQPGEKDEWHTHPAKSSYVVSGGKLKVYLKNGETILADEQEGTASWMDYVGEHYVENIGNTTVTIVYTEIK